MFQIGEYVAKLRTRAWLSHALCTPGQHTGKRRRKCMKQSRSCLQLCQIFTDFEKKKITYKLSSKPFRIWLLTTPPHLKYVATVPRNLSLMAWFADINVSQGSVATYARCGGIFIIHLSTNLGGNLPVNFFLKSV